MLPAAAPASLLDHMQRGKGLPVPLATEPRWGSRRPGVHPRTARVSPAHLQCTGQRAASGWPPTNGDLVIRATRHPPAERPRSALVVVGKAGTPAGRSPSLPASHPHPVSAPEGPSASPDSLPQGSAWPWPRSPRRSPRSGEGGRAGPLRTPLCGAVTTRPPLLRATPAARTVAGSPWQSQASP